MSRTQPIAKVTREIAAKPIEVFEAWTNPKHPATPWSKHHGNRLAIVSRNVGGLFYINMGPPMPLPTHFGCFLRLDRPNLIEHTWASEGTLGAETKVRISLKGKGKGTQCTLRHMGLRDSSMAHGHEEGWGMIIGWLAAGFEPRKRGSTR